MDVSNRMRIRKVDSLKHIALAIIDILVQYDETKLPEIHFEV